ncbi:TonB-dependent receptor [uncultured Bacteroides sp.]|uniref:TonB-dependent receptor n=1 Tax=uncultured Bacteroides sp. TaxID=162156 RepID=UPI00261F8DF2|nr:TonB-dependent receptor [uncultured Bacteroides sp.]
MNQMNSPLCKATRSLWRNSQRIPLYMRFFVLFLTCSVSLAYATGTYAQNIKISLRLQNKSVKEVLKEIEKQTDFSFFFNNKHIDVSRQVSVVTEGNVSDILNEIFRGTGVTYAVSDKMIVLSANPQQANKIQVKGTVTDAEGTPFIGATVMEIGAATNGVVTDIDGNFTLQVAEGTNLEISYIGYKTQRVKAVAGRSIIVRMEEDSELLEEVVVVGYGTQSKKSLTGAVGTMDMKEIETATVSSISHALGGKVAGLQVNMQSAQPGGAAKFRIRGEASTGAGNEPLIVIDGFPVNNTGSLSSGTVYSAGDTDNLLESLNPDDIESISVLKDAASTAIYGARAGHGVILITTKRGKEGRAKVTYSGSGSFQNIRSNYDVLSTREYMEVENMQLKERWMKENGQGIYAGYITTNPNPTPFTPKFDLNQPTQGTDWLDEVTRTGYMHQHNLSINGGGERTKYMASFNYMKQEGVVKNNGTSRFSARINLDQVVNKYLSVGLTASYSQNRYDNVPLGDGDNENAGILVSAIRFNPTIPVRDENGEYAMDPSRSNFPNPVSLLDITDETVKDRLMGSAFVVLKPIKGLELKGTLGADRRMQKRHNYIPKTTLHGAEKKGKANVYYSDATDYLMDLTATYNTIIKEKHHLKALVGYSYQQFNNESVNAGNEDFLMDSFLYHNLAAGDYAKPFVGSGASKNSLGSYFARVNYQYENKYLLEATLRADGAGNFDKDHRWGYFPSVSAGWVISEEKFMENTQNWLSNLKLRASFGQTGNSNIGNRIHTFYSKSAASNHQYVFGSTLMGGVYASELGNPNLTWETTTEFNVGLDMGFLNSRIRLTAEYFNRRITDILGSKSLPFYNEISSIADNAGSTQSNGFELTLNTANIQTRDFDWNTTLTLAHYNDRWRTRPDTWKPAVYEKKDDNLRAMWGYHALGILQPGEAAPKHQADLLPGQMVLEDRNNDGVLNDEDKISFGNNAPKIIYGFNNALRYKRFDLNIYFYGEAGRKVTSSYWEDWIDTNQNSQNLSRYVFDSFSSENPNTKNPSILASSRGNGDYYLKSLYFIRCGNITLGYNVPVKKSWGISNLRVYADVNNPFVITNWSGLDPETDTGTYSYPNVTSYSLGLNITF